MSNNDDDYDCSVSKRMEVMQRIIRPREFLSELLGNCCKNLFCIEIMLVMIIIDQNKGGTLQSKHSHHRHLHHGDNCKERRTQPCNSYRQVF